MDWSLVLLIYGGIFVSVTHALRGTFQRFQTDGGGVKFRDHSDPRLPA